MTTLVSAEAKTALAYCAGGCGWRECRRYFGRWLCKRCWWHRRGLLPLIRRKSREKA